MALPWTIRMCANPQISGFYSYMSLILHQWCVLEKVLFKYMTYFRKKLTYFAIFCKISQTFSYLFYSEYIWNFWSLHLTISYKHSILKWEILALQMPRVLVNSAVTLFNWIVPLLFSLLKYKNFKVTYFGK